MARNKVETLTRSESLVIWRRRLGWIQKYAAEELDMGVDRYRDFENNRHNVKNSWEEVPTNQQLGIGELKPFEVCFILRRRAGLYQREIAESIGMTRLWVIKMEEGTAPADRLRSYWNV